MRYSEKAHGDENEGERMHLLTLIGRTRTSAVLDGSSLRRWDFQKVLLEIATF